MPRLFSYTIPVDDGAAPNPFCGMCTLAICKPKIRMKAGVGDWVVGLGSVNAPSGNLGGKMVYAMRVDQIVSLRDYDRLAPLYWPSRIPKLGSQILTERLGDCIYDYAKGAAPAQRPGVHGPTNVRTDLGGHNALISRHYFYFGRNAIALPRRLRPIIHQTQSHKVRTNEPFVQPFINWLYSLGLEPNQLYGWPDYEPDWSALPGGGCAARC
jgi:hypothetical protein